MKTSDKDCLVLAIKIAEGMMRSGGETYRAEECCIKVLEACGASNISVIALPTALLASAEIDGEHRTESASIKSRGMDLDGIARYNSISRRLVSGEIGVDEAFAELEQKKKESAWLSCVLTAFAAGFFAFVFGGTAIDFLPTLIAALLAQVFRHFASKLSHYGFLSVLGSCIIIGVCARGAVALLPTCSQEAIIVGGIIYLVPGLALTNAVRDTLNGDLVSGVARFADAMITAIVIAAGIAIALSL
ncbi:MAG: threonine/serine exporter family protein [Clostridia bacterium]|nr:threonine/serine exporter family protein [Clostridia bacterium]